MRHFKHKIVLLLSFIFIHFLFFLYCYSGVYLRATTTFRAADGHDLLTAHIRARMPKAKRGAERESSTNRFALIR